MKCEEVESKKMLVDQRKRLQKQLRELEKITCMPQDVQGRPKEEWQEHQQSGMIYCRSTRERRRDLKRYKAFQDKKRNMQGIWCR